MDQWTDRLSEYLDGEMDATGRAELQAHLTACEPCAAELAGLREVVANAARLPERPPVHDLWPGIAARLAPAARAERAPSVRRRGWLTLRWSFSVPQLVAATLFIAAVSGLVGSLMRDRAPNNPTSVVTGGAIEPTEFVLPARPVSFVDPKYDEAVADLLQILNREGNRLEPRTLAAITRSLAAIDKAIAAARDALSRDPASAYLSRHIADARRRKLDVLRVAVDLTLKGS